ncbi:MAG: hypothetical protein HYW33_01020 [Candidatus Blackburnbacteria bacterium]|nr:hypothetical protein [Candidatus Blackburnbacteria bacterium]
MANHFHLILKQIEAGGIQQFLANLQNGYVKYFNLLHTRKGPLFQSSFRAVHIETDEQFLHTTRYVHLNPSTAYIVSPDNLMSYRWSSFPDYFGEKSGSIVEVSKRDVLSLAGGLSRYRSFVLDQADYQRELDKIKHLTLENT